MRKCIRLRMRKQAETLDGKTILIFRYLWKNYRKQNPVKSTGAKKRPKKKSMLARAMKKLFRRK